MQNSRWDPGPDGGWRRNLEIPMNIGVGLGKIIPYRHAKWEEKTQRGVSPSGFKVGLPVIHSGSASSMETNVTTGHGVTDDTLIGRLS